MSNLILEADGVKSSASVQASPADVSAKEKSKGPSPALGCHECVIGEVTSKEPGECTGVYGSVPGSVWECMVRECTGGCGNGKNP